MESPTAAEQDELFLPRVDAVDDEVIEYAKKRLAEAPPMSPKVAARLRQAL